MTLRFGPDWQRDIWQSPYRLRFELATGGSHINKFTSSYDRARALARAALPGDRVFGVIAAYPSAELGADSPGWADGEPFELLSTMGVATDPCEASWLGYVYPGGEADDEAAEWQHRAVRLDWNQADILLWSNIAHDIGVTPQASVLSKLVDVERGVVAYAYDDRGMDVVAPSAESVEHLYSEFDAWLLDYDRARMAGVFGSRGVGSGLSADPV